MRRLNLVLHKPRQCAKDIKSYQNSSFILKLNPLLFFLTSLLEYNCFTMACQFLLYNKVNQLYIYRCPISLPSCISLPPILPIPPLQVVTKHRADLPVLCGCFPLAISFTFRSVYMSMPLSHFKPSSFFKAIKKNVFFFLKLIN